MKNSTTLQINSLDALERLLGGDTELEVSMRQGVASAFAVRYLTGVITPEMQKAVTDEVAQRTQAALIETCGKFGAFARRNGIRFDLHPSFIDGIKAETVKAVDARVQELVTGAIKAAVERYESTVEREVNRSVSVRLEAVIERRVKEKFEEALRKIATV